MTATACTCYGHLLTDDGPVWVVDVADPECPFVLHRVAA